MSEGLDLKELEAKANQVVELAMAKGADTAFVITSWQRSHKVAVRGGEVEQLAEAESVGLELLVSRDQHRATVESCDLSDESLQAMVEQAMTLSRYTDQDTFYSLPDPERLVVDTVDLDLVDPTIETLNTDARIEIANELEARMLAQDSRLKTNGAAVNSARLRSALANSHGFCQSEEETLIRYQTSGFAKDTVTSEDLNSGRNQSGGRGSTARHREDLMDVEEVSKDAAHQILRKIGARKPKTGNFPVYFEPRIARSLWEQLINAMKGTAIFRSKSYLKDRLETKVAVPDLTIQDKPRIPRGLGSRCFDNEGVACYTSDLIRDGVLQTYLLSTYSANKLGLKTTGHAGGVSNLVIAPGDLDEKDMLKAMGTGLWVTTLLGSGTNLSSGDYSHGALGLWVENGEVAYPVMEFTINSNLDKMFQNIAHIGANVDTSSSIHTPGIVIGQMSISGT